MMISSENSGSLTEKAKFLFVVCREGVGSNSVICQFYSCWVQKKCGIRGKLKEDIDFKSQTFGI